MCSNWLRTIKYTFGSKKQKEQAKAQAKKDAEKAKKQAEKAKKQAEKDKKNKKTTSSKKVEKKTAVKASAVKPSVTAKKSPVAVPEAKPVVGIKLNDEELKKLRELDDRYAGKKAEAPVAPEAPVKGKGAVKKASK